MGGYSDSDLSCERSYEELLKRFIENEVELRVSNFKLQLSEQRIIKLKVKVEDRDSQLENVREELKLKEEESHKTRELQDQLKVTQENLAKLEKCESRNHELENKLRQYEVENLKQEELHATQQMVLQDKISSLREELCRRKHVVAANKESDKLMIERDTVNAKIDKLNAKIFSKNDQISNLKGYKLKQDEMNLQLTSKFEKCESRNRELENKLRRYEVENLKQDELHATQQMVLQDEIISLREELCRIKHDVVPANKESDKLMIDRDKGNAKIDKLNAKIFSKNDQISNLKKYKLKLEEINLQLTSKFEECESRNHELENKLRQYEELHGTPKMVLQDEISSLRKELCQRKREVVAANKKIDKLNAKTLSQNDQILNLKRYKSKQELGPKEQLEINKLKQELGLKEQQVNKLKQLEVNKLKQEVTRQKKEITRQNGVISDMAEKKKEAIRQQCFSLEYYRSRYVKLRQTFRRQ